MGSVVVGARVVLVMGATFGAPLDDADVATPYPMSATSMPRRPVPPSVGPPESWIVRVGTAFTERVDVVVDDLDDLGQCSVFIDGQVAEHCAVVTDDLRGERHRFAEGVRGERSVEAGVDVGERDHERVETSRVICNCPVGATARGRSAST